MARWPWAASERRSISAQVSSRSGKVTSSAFDGKQWHKVLTLTWAARAAGRTVSVHGPCSSGSGAIAAQIVAGHSCSCSHGRSGVAARCASVWTFWTLGLCRSPQEAIAGRPNADAGMVEKPALPTPAPKAWQPSRLLSRQPGQQRRGLRG